jgi:hypothetical protein
MTHADWRGANDAGEEAITQMIGRAAIAAGIEGLIVPAATSKRAQNLVVFPTMLLTGSDVQVLGTS